MGSGGEDEVTVAVPLPLRVVEVLTDPVRTTVESVVDVSDEVNVAFCTMDVAPEEVVARVIFDVGLEYDGVWDGVVVEGVFVPVKSVMPPLLDVVLDEVSWAIAGESSTAHTSVRVRRDAIMPSGVGAQRI
jgi:hypothetical protein